MTTEPEARAFLTDLTRLAQALDDAVLDSGLPAASGENAGIARSLPKSKSPCDDTLGDMRRAALDIIQPWAGNLSSDLTIGGVPHGETSLEPWTRWLIRHRVDLVSRPWWPDAEEELRNIHRHLGDHLAPPAPEAKAEALRGLVTIDYLKETGTKPGTIRSWKSRGILAKAGEQTMSDGTTVELYRFTKPMT